MEDVEWQTIMAGYFTNPEAANKIVNEKKREEESGVTVEDSIEHQALQKSFGAAPDADPDIQTKIMERAALEGDELRTLSDLVKEQDEDGKRS